MNILFYVTLKKYDVEKAFNDLDILEWRQTASCLNHIEVNDIVYIYVCEPAKQVRYKCKGICVNISYSNTTIEDNQYQRKHEICNKYMKLKLIANAKTIVANKDIENITKKTGLFP